MRESAGRPQAVARTGGTRSIAAIFGAHLAVATALLWPAIYNGFPLIFFDTGGYMQRGLTGEIPMGRSIVYGGFLGAFAWGPLGHWPAIAVQALLTTWIVGLALATRKALAPRWLLGLGFTLAALTCLPWYTAQLMPDWMAGPLVLVVYLLVREEGLGRGLGRAERLSLLALLSFLVACHMAFLVLAVGLVSVAVLLFPWRRAIVPSIVILSSIALNSIGNYVSIGHFLVPSPGPVFLLGRLIQDGVAKRYLDEVCPDQKLRLCALKDRLPASADNFMWGGADDPATLNGLGGVEAIKDEARAIVFGSLAARPLDHLRTAINDTIDQLGNFDAGDGIVPGLWHPRWRFEVQYPELLPAFDAARQQTGGFDFTDLNSVYRPVATLSLVLLVGVGLWRVARGIGPDARLLLFIGAALVGHASICGVLANPHDRYMARIIWLAPAALGIVGIGRWREAHS